MTSVTLQPADENSLIAPAYRPDVYIDGDMRCDIEVIHWSMRCGPAFDEVTLHSLSADSVCSILGPAGQVKIELKTDAIHGEASFVGTHWKSRRTREGFTEAVVFHRLASLSSEVPRGRYLLSGSQRAYLPDAPIAFNVSPADLASQKQIPLGSRESVVYQPATGRLWSAGNALAYLMTLLDPAVHTPVSSELTSLAGHVELPPMSFPQATLAEIMASIASHAGLRIRSSRTGLGLVVYRPGRHGRRAFMHLQPAGQQLIPGRSTITGIDWDGEPQIGPDLRMLGGPKRVEAAFVLQPGWDRSVPLPAYDELAAPNTAGNDMARLWALNEDATQEDDGATNLTTISDDFLARRPRALLPVLPRAGVEPGYLVEYNTAEGEPWQPWTGAVEIAPDRCSLRLVSQHLPAEYYQALLAGSARVRITASLETDRSLEFVLPGNPSRPKRLIGLPHALWWAVHQSSPFYQGSGQALDLLRDDTPILRAEAIQRRQQHASSRTCQITLPSTQTIYHPGDRVDYITGQDIALGSNGLDAAVVSVDHEFASAQKTRLVLETGT